MITFENVEVYGIEPAIRGMRNPLNSWERSDSKFGSDPDDACGIEAEIGTNDYGLMYKLACGGSCHAKYRRMIAVYVDITAPLYWWKEFDTYKVGTVANSCSTMHTIHKKPFEMSDFSFEYMTNNIVKTEFADGFSAYSAASNILVTLNLYRDRYLESKDKYDWYRMIQLLPSAYNQRRTIMLNYEVLSRIFEQRRNHRLDEWNVFCQWICELPLAEMILPDNWGGFSKTVDGADDTGPECIGQTTVNDICQPLD